MRWGRMRGVQAHLIDLLTLVRPLPFVVTGGVCVSTARTTAGLREADRLALLLAATFLATADCILFRGLVKWPEVAD